MVKNVTLKNIGGLFRNTRTRTIILLTIGFLVLAIVIGIFRLGGGAKGPATEANIRTSPNIQSVPGGFENPESPEYIRLQEKQNLQQAKLAQQRGTSAIPTIVRSSEFPGPPGPIAPGGANTCCVPCGCPGAGGGVGGLGASQACSLQPGTLSYDPQSRVMGTVGPDGKVRNVNGNEIGSVGPDGLVRDVNNVVIGGVGSVIAGMPIYNNLGKTIGRVGPDGKARDASGTVIGVLSPDGIARDMYGNVLGKSASSLAGTPVYNNQSRLIGTVGPDGKIRDSAGRVIGTVDCDGTARDVSGDVIGKGGATVAGATPVCDAQNQPLGTAGTDGKVRNSAGVVIGTMEANGVVLDAAGKPIGKSGCVLPPTTGIRAGTPVYDSQGRLIGTVGADGKVRDANGKIVGTVGPDGLVRDAATGAIIGKVGAPVPGTPVYDSQGHLIGTVGADGKVRDANGNIVGTVGPDGLVRDASGRIIGKTGPTIAGTPIYDSQGRLIGIAGPDGKVRDASGRVIGTVGPDGTVRDADGNIIGSTTAPGAAAPPGGALPGTTAAQQLAAFQAPTTPAEQAAQAQAAVAKRQAELISKQEAEQLRNQLQGVMTGQASQLIAAWVSPLQTYVEGTPPPVTVVSGTTTTKGIITKGGVVSGSVVPEPPPDVKAGTVMYGVLITSVNSDEPGPVLASIVAGKFKGGRLIGSLTNQGQKVMLTFNTLTLPDSPASIPVNVVAIDQNTARTALSSYTNNHYLLRYGTLFAAAFIQGYGQAFQTSGQTVISTGLATATTTPNLSPAGKFFVALGNVGTRYSSVLGNVFNTPPTVHVYSGTAVGLLFLSDVAPVPISPPSEAPPGSLVLGALQSSCAPCTTCPVDVPTGGSCPSCQR